MAEEESMETASTVSRPSSIATSGSQMTLNILVAPYTGQKQVSVLILIPQWKFDRFGKSNITRSLIKNLRAIDPEGQFIKIACTVLEEEGQIERIKEAEDMKVQLKGYIHPRGRKKHADLEWMNEDIVKYYNHAVSETNYDFIIGHVPYFTNGCFNLRDSSRDRGHTPKVILIVHELPQNEKGETDKELLTEWLYESDVVYSLEKSTREVIDCQIKILEREKVAQHKTYIPGFPTELFHVKREERRESESEKETNIMMITPMKKDEMKGFDFSLAVNAVNSACSETLRTNLTMLTANKSDKEEWEEEFKKALKVANRHLTFRCKFIDNTDELKRQLKKSDLFLFPLGKSSSLFGEEALSAIASGVPVLVSSHSGVGSFLSEMDEKDSVVDEEDEQSWSERIIETLKNPNKVLGLRNDLLLDVKIASNHQEFTKLICDAACAELEISMETDKFVRGTAKDIAKEIRMSGIPDESERYLVAFFERLLYLREKLEQGLLEKYLGKSLQARWKRLFSKLEQGKRKLLSVRRGSIIFTLFCPTEGSFNEISNDIWGKKVSKQLEKFLRVLDFRKPQCSLDGSNTAPKTSDGGNQVSALLLTTRWLFDFTGITTVTRSLVNNLRYHDPNGENVKITCAILEKDGRVEKFQIDEAEAQKVTLKGAVQPMGETFIIPETERLNGFSAAYYHNVFDKGSYYNFIIGHAPLFSYGAINLKKVYKGQNNPKIVLVIHELPKTKQGIEKETLSSWIQGTDIVFSIGEDAKNELERFVFGKEHQLYIPIHTLKDARCDQKSTFDSIREIKGKKITLMVGKKESDYNGVHLKLAMHAAAGAAEIFQERRSESKDDGVHLVLLGENTSDKEHLKTLFNEIPKGKDFLSFHIFTCQSAEQIQSYITKSSVFLLPLKNDCSKFGLEALSAAAAGVPILVSENSGMATLLEEIGESEHNVVRKQRKFDLDVKAWKEKIVEKIGNLKEIQQQNERIKETLLKNKDIATTHVKFISTIVPHHLCQVEEYIRANCERLAYSDGQGNAPGDRWTSVEGLGKTRKDPVRRVKFKEHSKRRFKNGICTSQKIESQHKDSQQDIKQLTDERLYKLSTKITKESDLRKLAIEGLKLESHDIDAHISDNRSDIKTAAYYTLQGWRQTQSDRTIAYVNMRDALSKVNMELNIDDVLK